MNRPETVIPSQEFDSLVSEIAAGIWNHLIDKPHFQSAAFSFYADIFEAVAESLSRYRSRNLKHQRRQ